MNQRTKVLSRRDARAHPKSYSRHVESSKLLLKRNFSSGDKRQFTYLIFSLGGRRAEGNVGRETRRERGMKRVRRKEESKEGLQE